MKQNFAEIFDITCRALGIDPAAVNADVFMVRPRAIRALNRTHRGTDKPTDVLSFPLLNIAAPTVPTREAFPRDINPATSKVELGDIVICPRIARRSARAIGQPLKHEIAFLYVHGLLHLLGYDHISEQDEKQMLAKQRQIMAKWNETQKGEAK